MANYDYGSKFTETVKSVMVWTLALALLGVVAFAALAIYKDPPKDWPKKITRADGRNCIYWDKKTFCEMKEGAL